MRKHALLLCAALLPLLCACGHRQVRKLELTKGDYSLRQHFDPSLERGLLASRRSPAAAALVDFLNSNSVEMRYAPAASAAPEYVLNERRLFIPQEAKSGTDIFVGVEALRGLEVFRAYETSGLETRVVEFEELGAMRFLQNYPHAAIALMQALARDVEQGDSKAHDIAYKSAKSRMDSSPPRVPMSIILPPVYLKACVFAVLSNLLSPTITLPSSDTP